MISIQEGVALSKGARVATDLYDYAVEYLPPSQPYAWCIRFAPGGGPSTGEVVRVWFADIRRVYSVSVQGRRVR